MPCCGEREKGPVSREEKWDSVVSVKHGRVQNNFKGVANSLLAESGRLQVRIVSNALLLLSGICLSFGIRRGVWRRHIHGGQSAGVLSMGRIN
jgi:hypothetical protein